MKQTKFTKGELNVDNKFAKIDTNSKAQWVSIRNDKGKLIAEFKGKHCGIPESEMNANAKLFIASPKLYDALFNLYNAVHGDTAENLKIALSDAKHVLNNI